MCRAAILLSLVAFLVGANGQDINPDWTITCTRDTMTIQAQAKEGTSTVPRLRVSYETGDTNEDTTSQVTQCVVDAPDGSCHADTGTGPCVSTLTVDLTTPAGDTGSCPTNTRPDENGASGNYEKLVLWTKASVNTDTGNNDGNGPDNPPATSDMVLYKITCHFAASIDDQVQTDPEVIITLLGETIVDPVTPAPPVVAINIGTAGAGALDAPDPFVTEKPSLGQEIRLQVSFTDATSYWQQIVATSCLASTTSDFASPTALVTDKCPEFDIDGKEIITGYAYPQNTNADNTGLSGQEYKVMNLDFKAFRIGAAQTLYLRCSVTICPDSSANVLACRRPQDIDVGNNVCTTPVLRSRYQHLMLYGSRSDAPESFTSQLSTVIVLQPDNIIVSPDGQAAAGYTCLTTSTFSVLLSVLSLLVLVSLAVTITTCLQRRGGKARDMDLPITYTNYAVTGSKS